MVVCDYQRVDGSDNVVLNRGRRQRVSLQSPLVPRSVFDEIGVFDSVRMSGDAEFLDRFRCRFSPGALVHVPEALYLATVRDGSLTAQAGVESRLGRSPEDAARRVEEFLSEPRRRYLEAYRQWHVESSGTPRVDFPIRARPFSAPPEHVRDVGPPARVVAGMATHLGRRDVVERAVRSIAAQVDELHLHLNDYDEPPVGVRLANVKITTPADYGDLNDVGKFLALERLDGTEFLFTVDDDIVYPPDYVRRMLTTLEQFGRGVALGVHAAVLANPMKRFYEDRSVAHFQRSAPHRYLADVLGTGTMAMHSSLLPVGLEDFRAPGMADLWFAIGCKRRSIPRLVIDRHDEWLQPLATETSIFGSCFADDSVQTQAAREAGAWGREVLRREAVEWGGDNADDSFFWRSFGFASASDIVLPERSC